MEKPLGFSRFNGFRVQAGQINPFQTVMQVETPFKTPNRIKEHGNPEIQNQHQMWRLRG
jgi:hypothetical protein